ncbi:hypothetical protein HXX76_000113 [Chlamydomonas incerta]|uniref:Uncharacterized protein n=1 Tax=Chlamydomonas incerta TaxID=51695 RepID=A0A835WDN7_CHLIN|nr:hypothetical protein HXX76_000113 [Chlamydomonas incerta]|eukprot:KAG2445497.1 hypothetical protein HXX76_000113 [Chlamydomonas incerta]
MLQTPSTRGREFSSSGDGNSSKGFAVIGHGYRKAHGAATAAVEPPEAPEDTQQGASGCTAMAVSAVAIASAAAATAAHSRRQDPAASAAAAAGADRILATVQDPDTAEMAGPLVLLGEAHVPVNPVRQQQQQRGEGGGYGGALLPGSGRLLEAPEQQHTPHLQLDGLGRATAPTRAWGYCPAGGAAAPAGGPPVPRATAPAAQVLRHRRLFGYTGRDALYDVLNQLGGSSSGDDEAAQMLHSEGLPATPRADTAARLPAPSTAPPAWHVVQLVPQQALLQAWAAQHHQQCLQHPGASPSATGECASVWSGCRTSTTTTTNTMRLSVTLGGVCVGLVSGTEIQDVHQDTDGGVAAQTTNTTQPGAAVTAAY